MFNRTMFDALHPAKKPTPRRKKPDYETLYWELVSAARDVVENWSEGDLAGAVNALDEMTENAIHPATKA